jgi:hypothetical protein
VTIHFGDQRWDRSLRVRLLWVACEIGADYEEKPAFNEPPRARRLGDRADVVLVATSAAAHPSAQEVGASTYSLSKIWDDANRSISGRTPRMIRQVFCVGWRAAASPPPESCGWSWRSGLGGAPTTGGRQPPGANVQLSRTALRRLRQSGERPGADKLRKPFDSGLRKCCTDRPTKQQPRSVISLDQRPTP